MKKVSQSSAGHAPSQNLSTLAPLVLAWLFTLLACASSTVAQDRAVVASVIAGGGGRSSGSRFGVTGTVGQADATVARLSGSRFVVDGGFQATIVALQSPGAPLLTVTRSGESLTVAWPSGTVGWILQQSNALGPAANWADSSGVSDNSVQISSPMNDRFYRLRKAPPTE